MSNYMTTKQYDRHVEATKACEEKLSIARKNVGKAAEHGDLSENAEYEAAIEESGFLAGRLEELRSVLVGVSIVDPRNTDPEMVSIGKTVTLRDTESGEEMTHHIVGVGTTRTNMGEVSYSAPLGAALVGSKASEIVHAKLPGGDRRFEVVSVAVYDE